MKRLERYKGICEGCGKPIYGMFHMVNEYSIDGKLYIKKCGNIVVDTLSVYNPLG